MKPDPIEEVRLAVHADSRWCEFGENSRAEHCDGTCRTIADVVAPVLTDLIAEVERLREIERAASEVADGLGLDYDKFPHNLGRYYKRLRQALSQQENE